VKSLQVRFTRSPVEAPQPVGTLYERTNRIYFQYDEGWLKTGLNLSPFRLPFDGNLFEHGDRAFGPLPGLFDDALPDGWGLLLMDRHFRRSGLDPATLSPLDRLRWLGMSTMGALTFHPPDESEEEAPGPFDLDELARQAQNLLSGRSSIVLPQLLRAGGSPGGARPKVLVGFNAAEDMIRSGESELPDGYAHWLVKFPAQGAHAEDGAAEYAYSLMAKAAGLEVPATRLFETAGGGRFFGARRFDRNHNRRFHMHTFGNLIQVNFRIPSCDYADLLKATAVLTRNHQEVLKAFRRMVFNVFAHNRDDHAKNFAFLQDEATGMWSLAPAYDLTFSAGPGGEHSMTLAGEGRAPGAAQILKLGAAAGVNRPEAERIMEEVRDAVAHWPRWAKQGRVAGARAREIGADLIT